MIERKQISQLDISQELYNNILEIYKDEIKFVDDIGPFRTGYSGKWDIVCVLDKYLICKRSLLYVLLDTPKEECVNCWQQVVLRVKAQQETAVVETYSPMQCKFIINQQLKRLGFTDETINQRLKEFEVDYNEDLAQQHSLFATKNVIRKFNNCVYYDINKGHSYFLGQIFPELVPYLKNLAVRAKKDKKYKSIPNFYVGMLAFKTKAMRNNGTLGNHEKTYNWIVQQTTQMLLDRINAVCGMKSNIVYMNTDGVVISKPKRIIPSSNEFGKFKIESPETTFYTYRDANYEIVQYGDEIKGNLPIELRKYVDLRQGRVVHFTAMRDPDTLTFKYNVTSTEVITDIREV